MNAVAQTVDFEARPSTALTAPIGAGNALMQVGYLKQQQDLLDELENLEGAVTNEQVSLAILDLGRATQEGLTQISSAFSQISSATSEVLALAQQIRQAERQARWAAAKATGEDFVVIDGEPVPIPVNTALNNQYDLTKRRYAESLRESKYLGYLARLAIEQRIGRRLGSFDGPLGAVDSPSQWADDICRMNGVNYDDMREGDIHYVMDDLPFIRNPADPAAVTVDLAVLASLLRDTSPYVGDYVAKLETFVDAYNASFPFHEGDDEHDHET